MARTHWLIAIGAVVGGFVAVGLAGCGADAGTTDGSGGSVGGNIPMGGQGQGGQSCTPESELCDGIDNDCDGAVDEDCPCIEGDTQSCYSGDPDDVGIGVCDEGVQSCDVSGSWGPCEDVTLPCGEVCDGADNDCNAQIDEGFGQVTCGVGTCQVTVDECIDGVPNPCTPGQANQFEACDGVDDDCDGAVDEGCSCVDGTTQACYSGSAVTQNVGECHDGLQTCNNGQWGACLNDQTPQLEACNNLDDDCDGFLDNGDPGGGAICDTGDPGVCGPGVEHCVGGNVDCVANETQSAEICDGLDNDCIEASADGVDDPGLNVPCDGPDSDLCIEGVMICRGNMLSCNDSSSDDLDICDGNDNDCDPASADGTEDPQFGAACDGNDSDLCLEGMMLCNAGQPTCSDNTTDDLDICDGIDDDCNLMTDDGIDETWFGTPCDGTDGDLCEEGSYVCVSAQQSCTDTTGTTTDICDGLDNDCDPSSADGSEDPLDGTACDGPDTDECLEGTYSCEPTGLSCSDNTTSTAETCNGLDDNCDGNVDEGFNLDDDPACSAGVINLGSISGDTGSGSASDTWWNEEWHVVTLTEDSFDSVYVSADIVLTSPPGVDFDLYVYCFSCGGGLADSSINAGLTGHTDTVEVRRDDVPIFSDTFDVVIEVRYFDSNICAYWTLDVTGNTAVSNSTCN